MSLNFKAPSIQELAPRITVFGVGGAGGNAVNNMIRAELQGVEFVVANTDAQALAQSRAERKIQMGLTITQGLGAGAKPEVGRGSAEEAMDEIMEHLQGSHMVFITCGMGGGTGTGAAPVIARMAKEQGILTVGVVTKPFQFEGSHRMRQAEAGVKELQQWVDTLIVIPNQNLFRVANDKTTFAQAFGMADEVLHSGVRGITDLMVMPGLINLDFADVRTIMNEMGKAMMGTGEATGERRALDAAEAAIANPLLDEVSMKGARGVLIHITGGMDLTLFEVDEAANRIRSEVDPEANIIIGSTFNEALEGRIRVSLVATGIDAAEVERNKPSVVTQFPRPAAARQSGSPAPVAASMSAGALTGMAPAMDRGPAPLVASNQANVMGNLAQVTKVEQPILPQAVMPSSMMAMEPAGATLGAIADELPEEDHAPVKLVDQELDLPPIAATVAAQAETRGQDLGVRSAEPSFRDEMREVAMQTAPLAASAQAQGRDPFAEADLVNAANQPPRKRKAASLFERITGRARPDAEPAAPSRNHNMDRAGSLGGPSFDLQSSDHGRNRHDLSDRLQPASEDDQLDIPAFLRRQAN